MSPNLTYVPSGLEISFLTLTTTAGTYVRFGDNAVVLLTKDAKGNLNPIGKRIFGPVAKELRENWRNITNMASEVI